MNDSVADRNKLLLLYILLQIYLWLQACFKLVSTLSGLISKQHVVDKIDCLIRTCCFLYDLFIVSRFSMNFVTLNLYQIDFAAELSLSLRFTIDFGVQTG